MAIAPDYSEPHRAIDQLNPVQAEALYVAVESMLGEMPSASPAGTSALETPRTAHRLAFTAVGSGPADLSERAEDYLRVSGFGHPAP
jgi:hypothetical protein